MFDSVRPRRNDSLVRRSVCDVRQGLILMACVLSLALCADAQQLNNLFFLHHSTGNGLIVAGNMRGVIQAYNNDSGTAYAFWDHGYNSDGLRNPAGAETGINYDVPNDNTNPDGLHYIFTSTEADATACRNLILANHQVIAFKSCFPASEIPDAETLAQYQTYYLEMRAVFDQRPDKLFVVMSTPPLHRLATSSTSAAYARQFADWLKSDEYLSGYSNVVCFDLFNYLAGSDNFLKYEYEGSHSGTDSHPNELANQTVGPIFAQFLIDSALAYSPSPSPTPPTPLTMTINANGGKDEVTVYYPETVSVTVEMNAGDYAGTEADWWVLACAPDSGEWYYLNSAMEWTIFNGDLAFCQPVYQGPLFDMSPATVLNEYTLPYGDFIFYFAVDQRDDILNYPGGPIQYAIVTVGVQ